MTPRKMMVATQKYSLKCPHPMTAQFITIHNTANDASANNEISYMRTNNDSTSFHFAVDDIEVVQGLPLNRNGWHAGDGTDGTGNRKTIGIEICYSKSGGSRFIKAEQNAAKFTAQLLKERKWGIDRVKKHQDWSGKYCPHRTLDLGWTRFLNMVEKELNSTPPADNFTWVKWDTIKDYVTVKQPTNLWNFNATRWPDVKLVKEFSQGEVIPIYGEVYNKALNATYYLTEYSFKNKVTNGFNQVDLEAHVPPTPPQPEPTPIPEPTPTPEPTPDPEPTPNPPTPPQPTPPQPAPPQESLYDWLVELINRLVEWLKSYKRG